MLRNQTVLKKNNQDDLIFQIIDWHCNDIQFTVNNSDDENEDDEKKYKKKKKKLVLRGYGVTDKGHSISIHIFNFKIYFYIKIPQEWSEMDFKYFKNACLSQIPEYNHDGLHMAKIEKRKDFYGFSNNAFYKFGVFIFKNQGTYYAFLRLFREKK